MAWHEKKADTVMGASCTLHGALRICTTIDEFLSSSRLIISQTMADETDWA